MAAQTQPEVETLGGLDSVPGLEFLVCLVIVKKPTVCKLNVLDTHVARSFERQNYKNRLKKCFTTKPRLMWGVALLHEGGGGCRTSRCPGPVKSHSRAGLDGGSRKSLSESALVT